VSKIYIQSVLLPFTTTRGMIDDIGMDIIVVINNLNDVIIFVIWASLHVLCCKGKDFVTNFLLSNHTLSSAVCITY
jgi:hypothetical protein